MKNFIGKISVDFCENIITECQQHDVEPYKGNMDLDPNMLFYEEHLKQKKLAKDAGYTRGDSIEFRHYYPEHHFSTSFVNKIEDITKTKQLLSFVSEIRPGKCAPWHWDINPWLDDYPDGKINRYVCFIDKPKYGQAFMIEDESFYLIEQGSIFKYPSLESWHAGFNAGLKTKFLFTYTGIEEIN